MRRINELYVERANRMLAVGILGRIVLEAFKLSLNTPESELSKLFTTMEPLLPEHYLSRHLDNGKTYKAITFTDSQSFILVMSEAEAFFKDVMIEILCRCPDKINMSGHSEDDVRAKAYKEINNIKGEKQYKDKLIDILSAPNNMFDDLWSEYAEAKARRNIGIHNSWIVNDYYRKAIKNIGLNEPTENELFVDVQYFLRAREVATELMKRIKEHCETQFP